MLSQVSVMSPVVRHRFPPTSFAPFPDFAHAVLAQAVHDVAVHLVEGLAHDRVGRISSGREVSFAIFS